MDACWSLVGPLCRDRESNKRQLADKVLINRLCACVFVCVYVCVIQFDWHLLVSQSSIRRR